MEPSLACSIFFFPRLSRLVEQKKGPYNVFSSLINNLLFHKQTCNTYKAAEIL